MLTELKHIMIASLMMAVLVAGCASPTPTPSPSAEAPTVTPVITAAPTPGANATTPTPTAAPTATPAPKYTNGSPVTVSDIRVQWDTTGFQGRAFQTATFKVKNEQADNIVLDVIVLYKVTTPATLVNPDGSTSNFTNTITKAANVGFMQALDERTLTFEVDHTKNVPTTISIVVQWRGGKAVVFSQTVQFPDSDFGVYEY